MKTYLKLNVNIAPYRTFEEELEIYTNNIDYIWKMQGELIFTKQNQYDGVIVFNNQEYLAKALKDENRLLILLNFNGEVYSLVVDTTYNSKTNNSIFFSGNGTNFSETELGFGDCRILEKPAKDINVTNITNRINKLIKKDNSVNSLFDDNSFSLQNPNLLGFINTQSEVIKKCNFNVYKHEKNLKKIFMYSFICTAVNDMVDYIKNERLIESGEKFIIDQEILDKIDESINNSIIKNNIKLETNEENYIKKLGYDFINSIVFKGNSAGVILGTITSGFHEILDVCEESPAQFLLYDFINVNGNSDVEWLIDTIKNMYDLKDPKCRGNILLNSLELKNIDKDSIYDYAELYSGYDTIRQNLGITNSQMNKDMLEALRYYKITEQLQRENKF